MNQALDVPITNAVTGKTIQSRVAVLIVCASCEARVGAVRVATRAHQWRTQLTVFSPPHVEPAARVTRSSLISADGPPRDWTAFCPNDGDRRIPMESVWEAVERDGPHRKPIVVLA